MKLTLVRHAIAEERDAFAATGQSDDLRPLTKKGRSRMRNGADGLMQVLDAIDVLATSPLVRAVETAHLIAEAFDDVPIAVVNALSPEAELSDFIDWLHGLDEVSSVVVVGHSPHLCALGAWLITGRPEPVFEMKKGSAAMLEFPNGVRAGAALLRWLLTPAQLRRLGE